MINLLPAQEKALWRTEQIRRQILILGALFLTGLLCFSLILLAIYFYIAGQLACQQISLDAVKKDFEKSESQALEKEINSANLVFSQIYSFYQKQTDFSDIIENIAEALPDGIYLTGLSLEPIWSDHGAGARASISGFSPDRTLLFDFKKNLEGEPIFQEIHFPASNWTKPADINFYLTLESFPE